MVSNTIAISYVFTVTVINKQFTVSCSKPKFPGKP